MMSVPGTPGRPPSKVVVSSVSPIFNVTGLALRQPVPTMRMTFRLPSGPIEHGGSVKVIEPSGLTLPHLYTAVPAPSPVVVKIPGAASWTLTRPREIAPLLLIKTSTRSAGAMLSGRMKSTRVGEMEVMSAGWPATVTLTPFSTVGKTGPGTVTVSFERLHALRDGC